MYGNLTRVSRNTDYITYWGKWNTSNIWLKLIQLSTPSTYKLHKSSRPMSLVSTEDMYTLLSSLFWLKGRKKYGVFPNIIDDNTANNRKETSGFKNKSVYFSKISTVLAFTIVHLATLQDHSIQFPKFQLTPLPSHLFIMRYLPTRTPGSRRRKSIQVCKNGKS